MFGYLDTEWIPTIAQTRFRLFGILSPEEAFGTDSPPYTPTHLGSEIPILLETITTPHKGCLKSIWLIRLG